METMRHYMSELVKGWDVETGARRSSRETLDEIVDPMVYEEAVDLIEEHKEAGRDVIIISSSGTEVVEPIGERLGVDRAIGTQVAIEDGKYTGEILFYAYGEGKADAMRALAEENGYDLAECYSYSDSATDLPMLEIVGHPVGVNPDAAAAQGRRRARLAGPRLRAPRRDAHDAPAHLEREHPRQPPHGAAGRRGHRRARPRRGTPPADAVGRRRSPAMAGAPCSAGGSPYDGRLDLDDLDLATSLDVVGETRRASRETVADRLERLGITRRGSRRHRAVAAALVARLSPPVTVWAGVWCGAPAAAAAGRPAARARQGRAGPTPTLRLTERRRDRLAARARRLDVTHLGRARGCRGGGRAHRPRPARARRARASRSTGRGAAAMSPPPRSTAPRRGDRPGASATARRLQPRVRRTAPEGEVARRPRAASRWRGDPRAARAARRACRWRPTAT